MFEATPKPVPAGEAKKLVIISSELKWNKFISIRQFKIVIFIKIDISPYNVI